MKKILMSALMILLSLSIVYAQILPLPISGTVSPVELGKNTAVTIKNLNTGEEKIVYTNDFGQYLYDWANSDLKYQWGNIFRITVRGVAKEVTYEGNPLEVNFDLCPAYEPCPECPICPEPEVCPDCPTCPEIVSCEEQGYILPEDCPVEECPAIPFWYEYVETIIALVIAGLVGAGVQFTVSKSKTGKLFLRVTRHKHANYPYYHSVYTVHQKEPHKKGEAYPKYVNGRYVSD